MDWWDKIKKSIGITESPAWQSIVEWIWRFLFAVLLPLVIVFLLTGYKEDDGSIDLVRLARDSILFILAILTLINANIRSHAADKQAKAANKQAEIANKQAETDRKRQGAETLAKSVELLASNNQKGEAAIESRIGGIYALEKLASADADNYAAPVMKMLVTYIRENAQKTALPVESMDSGEETTTDRDKRRGPAHLGEDVKTAFAALKRLYDSVLNESGLKREPKDELSFADTDFRALRMDEVEWIDKPDLQSAKLRKANLRGAQLQGAKLLQVQLQGAFLNEAQLQGADLSGAQLQDAFLVEAQLQGAYLFVAHLQKANLSEAQLQYAKLNHAQMQRVHLVEAQLQGADLSGANLEGATLEKSQLQNVRYYYYNMPELIEDSQLSDNNTDNFSGDVQYWEVGYSGRPSFLSEEDESPQENSEWDLKSIWNIEPILEDMSKKSQKFFLRGVLRNFAEKDKEEPTPWALQCRLAVRELQKSHEDLWDVLDLEWKNLLLNERKDNE